AVAEAIKWIKSDSDNSRDEEYSRQGQRTGPANSGQRVHTPSPRAPGAEAEAFDHSASGSFEVQERGLGMATLQVRIFPHSQKEFPSEDSLLTWLLTGLRGRGGVYLLRNADAVKDVPTGSVVLFRYGNRIVGEAVVWKGKETFPERVRDR